MTLSDQIIAAAKEPFIGYNEKDWNKVTTSVTAGYVYDEVATGRQADGVTAVLDIWKAWGTGFPDLKAT